MSKILTFLHEVKGEIYKITWPGRDDLIGTVIIVCILTLVAALILGGMDALFSLLLRKITLI
ncbi:preprotein translocase subunit SecE [Candidatus Dependentiae bacterium]|nr:preprotein translocase subunit SecE [Candidatus Dependentiae bacterium]MBU4387325.1 preprotein translocase subunit SecE [Candidatus Dependentiae bacterium]MCG2756210.1 preprotein translocase subunit SecE [Candidatus Dependentiae bacterium]